MRLSKLFVLLAATALTSCDPSELEPKPVAPLEPAYTLPALNIMEQKLIGKWMLEKEEDTTFLNDTVVFGGVTIHDNFSAPFYIQFNDTLFETPPAGKPQSKRCKDGAYVASTIGPKSYPFLTENDEWWYYDSTSAFLSVGATHFYRIWNTSANSLVLRHELEGGATGYNTTTTLYFKK